MINFSLNLLLLSLIFALLGVTVLAFRHKNKTGNARMMYRIWIPIMILSVLPLRLCPGLSVSGNLDLDAMMLAREEQYFLRDTEGTPLKENVTPEKDFRLVLIKDVPEVDPVERINALYSLPHRIITASEAYGVGGFLDRSDSYIYPFIYTMLLIWIFGAVASLSSSLDGYRYTKKRLTAYSSRYYPMIDEGRLERILDSARISCGVRRSIALRVVDWQAAVSPCIMGIIHPTIYIGMDLLEIEEDKLELILAHELTHYRRKDQIFKTAMLVVASIHWFNPIAKAVSEAAYEDCEFSCDQEVLSIYGDGVTDYYMMTILDIAEKYCRSAFILPHSSRLAEGMYISASSGKSFLKRRYANMKKRNDERSTRSVFRMTGVLLAFCLLCNVVIMSACGVGGADDVKMQSQTRVEYNPYVINPVAAAVRNYFGLPDVCEPTHEQFSEIKTIDAIVDYDSEVLRILVNGEEQNVFNNIVEKTNMDRIHAEMIMKGVNKGEMLENNILNKFNAFFQLVDKNDPDFTEEMLNQVLSHYPNIGDCTAYVFDQYATRRECNQITRWLEMFDFFFDFAFDLNDATALVSRYIYDNDLNASYTVTESGEK